MKPKAAVIWVHLGPYHIARAAAAAKLVDLTLIELAPAEQDALWGGYDAGALKIVRTGDGRWERRTRPRATMSDTVTPVGRVNPSFTGPNLVTGVIADPPRSLFGAAAGTILKGTVLGRGPDGLTSVATDKGVVKVATNAQIPAGSAVTLEVRNAGDRLQVLILSVETATGRQGTASMQVSPGSGTPSTFW